MTPRAKKFKARNEIHKIVKGEWLQNIKRFTIEKNWNGRWIVFDTLENEPYQTWDDEILARQHMEQLNNER